MRLLLLAVATFAIFIPQGAFAQGSQIYYPPNSEYRNEALEKMQRQRAEEHQKKGFMRPGRLYVSLVQYDYFEDDQFGLLFTLGDIISGCFKYSPLEYQVEFVQGNYMNIAIRQYKREKIKTDNPNKECPSGNQTVSGLVVLSKSDLQNKGVYEMRLTNGGAMDRYAVAYYDDRMEIIPQTKSAFIPEGLQGATKDRLIHYNRQNDVLALHVPMASKSDNISDAVHNFAAQKGLAPLDMGDLERYPSMKNVYYFTDASGLTIGKLDEEDFVELGMIDSKQAYEGTEGLSEIGKPLKVFATKPGKTL